VGEYDDMTLEELREEAADRDIQGRSGMSKAELIKALESDDSGDGGGETVSRRTGEPVESTLDYEESVLAGDREPPEADVHIVAGIVKPEEVRNLAPFGVAGPNDPPEKAKGVRSY
jgi:Rho termination factor, N-terminal domain